MAPVFRKLFKAMTPRTGTASTAKADGAPSSGPHSKPPGENEPEGLTDIRRNSRMTAALDLKQGLDVSEPMPLDDLPDDIARELSAAGGEDAPTVRLRVSDLQKPADGTPPAGAEAKPQERT